MAYDNTNRGAIWRNDKKEKDSHPDFKGSLNIDGKEYWVSAWKRKPDAKPESPALSFAVKSKDEVNKSGMEQAQAAVSAPPQPDYGFIDDDIPFAPYEKGSFA